MKSSLFIIALLAVLAFQSCEEKLELPKPVVTNFGAIDIGNTETSGDIYVRFSTNFELGALSIMLIPEDQVAGFGMDQVNQLESSQQMEINGAIDQVATRLNNIKDVNGDPIENRAYVVGLVFNVDGAMVMATESVVIELTDAHPLLGEYTGTWTDNLHQNVAVSMRLLSFSDSTLKGEFFATGFFEPYLNGAAAGAKNDGAIKLVLSSDNQIELFQYNQMLPTYMEGCPGLYTGDGSYEELEISINYSGEDCDGIHEGGKLELERWF